MKLWILSDLHIDVNRRFPFELPTPHPDHDVVIIAGDICQGLAEGVRFIVSQKLNAKPVIYVGGNHEFYGHDRHAELANGRAEAARHPNIHLLERDSVVIDGVEFLRVHALDRLQLCRRARAGARHALCGAAHQRSSPDFSRQGRMVAGASACGARGSRAWLADQLAQSAPHHQGRRHAPRAEPPKRAAALPG